MSGASSSIFFWSDYLGDPQLRMCSEGARGIWMDLLCIMHPAGGYLFINGQPISDIKLAKICSISVKKLAKYRQELIQNGVASLDDNGVIFCRRMVREKKRSDTNKKNGMNGGNPALTEKSRLTEPDKPPINPPDNRGRITEPPTDSDKAPDKPHAGIPLPLPIPLPQIASLEALAVRDPEPEPLPPTQTLPFEKIPLRANPPAGWLEEFMKIKGWNEPSAQACWDKFAENYQGQTCTLTAWKLKWCQWWSREKEVKKERKSNRPVL